MIKKLPLTKIKRIRKWIMRYKYTPFSLGNELKCGCGIASYLTYLLLSNLEFPVVFCENSDHAFLQIHKTIIDVTARQFDLAHPEILVYTPAGKHNLFYYHKISNCGNDISTIKEIFKYWPNEQSPFFILKRLNKLQKLEIETLINTKLKL